MIPQEAIKEEALRRYDGDVDGQTGASIDDWGYSECQRRAFVAGALFAATEAAAAELETAADWLDGEFTEIRAAQGKSFDWLCGIADAENSIRGRAAAIRDGQS